jgi:subtilisin family serine protease
MRLLTSARRLAGLGILTAGVTLAAVAISGPATAASTGEIRNAGGASAVADSYIVVLKGGASATGLAARYGASVTRTYSTAVRGFEARMSAGTAKKLAADASVAYVEQNHVVSLSATQTPTPSWGLDRIDQRNLPLDNSYTFPSTAASVHAYIIDTGIRLTHTDFGGRAVSGTDTVDNDADATDCNGHGTHVAANVGGSSFGVAKSVSLVAVRVLDCGGSGTLAGVIAGIDWVTANAIRPAVANMSLGGSASSALDNAVTNSIASGVTYAIAAGNSNQDACRFSPARTPDAITVGATDINDNRASFSNFGRCVDIFAPGVSITSAWLTSDTATNTISGTSMATPHVCGAAALVLQAHPGFSPIQVRDALVAAGTSGVVRNPGRRSPNLLLFVSQTP